jgi:hypothetical protein
MSISLGGSAHRFQQVIDCQTPDLCFDDPMGILITLSIEVLLMIPEATTTLVLMTLMIWPPIMSAELIVCVDVN